MSTEETGKEAGKPLDGRRSLEAARSVAATARLFPPFTVIFRRAQAPCSTS